MSKFKSALIFLPIFAIALASLVEAVFVDLSADEYVYLPSVLQDSDGSTATPTPTPTMTPSPTPTATGTPTDQTQVWLDSWMLNETNETSSEFSGASVNVSSVYTKTVNGDPYMCITASGLPNYEITADQDFIDDLNNRPRANSEFGMSGETNVTLNEVISFGEDVGFRPSQGCTSGNDGFGYWPPGPVCPEDQSKDQCFPLTPEPSNITCEGGLGSVGTWINGVSIYNWSDGMSYNNAGVWNHIAQNFEVYDLDVCLGHAANGDYHHHNAPTCLMAQVNEAGDGHSQIFGFSADGYPVYGPWHANGVLAESCWKPRDYTAASSTGCGVDGARTCLLNDQYDPSAGTSAASSAGPTTGDTVSSASNNTFTATSGYYFEDYYYDSTCTAQGGQYLDEHNGHDHDGLGYHYHITVEDAGGGEYIDVFPYSIGPTFYGSLQEDAIANCSNLSGPPGPPGGP